jgi:hypothetical protein
VQRQRSTFCPDVNAPAALRQYAQRWGRPGGQHKLGGRNIKKYLPLRNQRPARSRFKRTIRGKPTLPFVGKADDTAEETGKSTLWDRRGMGSSIQGKILGDNVGKVRRAAGTGDNLRRLLQRGKTEVEESPL